MKSGGLNRRQDFAFVLGRGASWANRLLVLKAVRRMPGPSRYGFVVSRKVGGAVVRNRVKRRLREVMRAVRLLPGWDIVLIARNPAAVAGYSALAGAAQAALTRAGLLTEKNEEICPEAN